MPLPGFSPSLTKSDLLSLCSPLPADVEEEELYGSLDAAASSRRDSLLEGCAKSSDEEEDGFSEGGKEGRRERSLEFDELSSLPNSAGKGRLLLRGSVNFDGSEYKARRVARDKILGSENLVGLEGEGSEEEEEESEEEAGESEEEEGESEEGVQQSEGVEAGESGNGESGNGESEREEGFEDEEDEDEDSNRFPSSSSSLLLFREKEDEIDALERQLMGKGREEKRGEKDRRGLKSDSRTREGEGDEEGTEREDSKSHPPPLLPLPSSVSSEIEKGRAIIQQKELFDHFLTIRILLQKPLLASHDWPVSHSDFSDISTSQYEGASGIESENIKLSFKQSKPPSFNSAIECWRQLREVSWKLLEVKRELLNQFLTKKLDASLSSLSKNNFSLESFWEEMENDNTTFTSFRNSSVDRWHRKIHLMHSAFGTSEKSKNLKAFQQPVSEQVKAALNPSNPFYQRLLERSKVLKNVTARTKSDQATEIEDPECPEIALYDDSEFYHVLLQQFLESKANSGESVDLYALQKSRNKKRKAVDRRASKGRKLRYTVHDPLVNFLPSQEQLVPPVTDRLFENLFGRRSDQKR